MKKYFPTALVASVVFFLIDYSIGDAQSFLHYAIRGILLIAIFMFAFYLDDKGWNSWKKIASLFKSQKSDA